MPMLRRCCSTRVGGVAAFGASGCEIDFAIGGSFMAVTGAAASVRSVRVKSLAPRRVRLALANFFSMNWVKNSWLRLLHRCAGFAQRCVAASWQPLRPVRRRSDLGGPGLGSHTHRACVYCAKQTLRPPLGHVLIALWQQTNPGYHIRIMTRICSSRCQGRPSTRASNCGCVSVIGAATSDTSRGHAKRP